MQQKSETEIENSTVSPPTSGPNTTKWAVGMCLPLLVGLLIPGVARTDSNSNQSSDAQVQVGKDSSSSVSINNGAVTIDGEAVPPDAHEFTSRRGNHYRINRRAGSVEVHQE